MLFTADDVYARFRRDVDDPLEGTDEVPDSENLWSDVDIYYYMNVATERVAAKTRSLFKTRTFPITAGDPYVALPQGQRLLDVRDVRSLGNRRVLTEFNINEAVVRDDYGVLYMDSPMWNTSTGVPFMFTLNYAPNKMRLYPIPQADDVIEVTASLLPFEMSKGMPMPFSEYEDIELVLLWMKSMAYSKHDADAQDLARANDYEAQFNTRALTRQGEQNRRQRAPGNVRFVW